MQASQKTCQYIKKQLRKKVQNIQNRIYASIVQSQEKYLQKLGLLEHQEDMFAYIGKLLKNKGNDFQISIIEGESKIKLNIKPTPQPQPQPSKQIVQQVQYVLNNIDLPLSLFRRNDNYWSIDNPKTLQTKQYLKSLHQKDQKFKFEMKQKKKQIQKQQFESRNKTIDVIHKQQESNKKQLQQKINKKIEELKKNSQQRKKAISQSVEMMKQKGKPLFRKIEQEFKQKVEIPSLEQKKRKLSELRQVMRSVPLEEIQSHKEKYEKLKSEHQYRAILNEPANISFKSHFYEEIKSMSASKFAQFQTNLSLHQRRLQYSRMVKQNHKPSIDDIKREEMQSRIKLMNKRRARAKKVKKEEKNSDDDSDQDKQEEEEEEEEQPQPQPSENQDDDDDSDKVRPQKDDQYQPTHKQRYKMGINYLKVAKKLADKTQLEKKEKQLQQSKLSKRSRSGMQNNLVTKSSRYDNKGIDFNTTENDQKGQQTVQPQSNKKRQKYIWVSKYDEEPKRQERIKYKNYLRQLNMDNDDKNLMNTSQIKKQIQKSQLKQKKPLSRNQYQRKPYDIQAQIMYHTNLQNKIRNIEERAKNQEQLLKFKRINRDQKINKKMAIDDAVVDTIKVRLLMMNKTLDK